MSDESNKKFVPLFTQSKAGSSAHKREAILAVKEAEKDINSFVAKLKEAEDFLNAHADISPESRENLISSIEEGKKDLLVYKTELENMKARLMVALKEL